MKHRVNTVLYYINLVQQHLFGTSKRNKQCTTNLAPLASPTFTLSLHWPAQYTAFCIDAQLWCALYRRLPSSQG